MKFNGEKLPTWFVEELYIRTPNPNINTIIEMLLEDYLKRNDPTVKKIELERLMKRNRSDIRREQGHDT